MRFLMIGCLALVAGGCATQARIESKESEIIAKWKTDHPDEILTPEKETELKAQAREEVMAEVERERSAALAAGGEATGGFASGNIVAGILGLIQLGAIGLGAYKKAKGGA